MKNKFYTIVQNLRNRPEMYLLGYDSYASLTTFLIGFGEGIKGEDLNYLDDFDSWLQDKVDHTFALHWSSYILNEICCGNEALAKSRLLELLTEYIQYKY